MDSFRTLIKLIRVKSWIKNIFIFIPLFFNGDILNEEIFLRTFFIFIGFTFATSFIYIINDHFDKDFDSKHPTKRNRPIASGKITSKNAITIGIVFLILAIIILAYTSQIALYFTLFYIFINLLYSYRLKHIPIIDFVVVSLGFVIRILIGGYSNDIFLSKWIIIMVFLLSLFIATSKRRDDILQYHEKKRVNRKVVELYNLEFIDKIIGIISSVLIVAYLLYITSNEIEQKFSIEVLLLSFLFVVIGIFRYNYITYFLKKSGSPVTLLYKDNFLKVTVILWVLVFFIAIYVS